jgi:hypothetical protein
LCGNMIEMVENSNFSVISICFWPSWILRSNRRKYSSMLNKVRRWITTNPRRHTIWSLLCHSQQWQMELIWVQITCFQPCHTLITMMIQQWILYLHLFLWRNRMFTCEYLSVSVRHFFF